MSDPFTSEVIHEICCPNCGKTGNMVQIQKVWQQYGIYYNEDGNVEYGHLEKDWAGDGEEDVLQCNDCAYEFSLTDLESTPQAIELQTAAEERGEDE